MAEGTGTGVPEPHQEIEDEPSIHDTNLDLTLQETSGGSSSSEEYLTAESESDTETGGGENAIPNTESQVGIANPNTHQATPSEEAGEEDGQFTPSPPSAQVPLSSVASENALQKINWESSMERSETSGGSSSSEEYLTAESESDTETGGGEIAIPNTKSQVGIANPNTHQATPSEGTGEPECHQEIEDEPSILDTNFDLTSQSGGEEGQTATTSTRQPQVGIANTSLIQTSSSEGGGEIAIPNTESQVGIANPNIHQATPSEGGGEIAILNTESQVGIANPNTHQAKPSEGTGEPERHQEIEDEPSILDTNSDLTSQAGGEEGQTATTSTRQLQVGIANTSLIQTSSSEGGQEIAIQNAESQVGRVNPNTHQATPLEVVVAGGEFRNAYFGPYTTINNFEGRNYVNQTFIYHLKKKQSSTNQAVRSEKKQLTAPGEKKKKKRRRRKTASGVNRPERTGSTFPKEIAARSEEEQPTASGVNRPERTGSTFPKEIETVDALMEDSKFNEAVDLLECLPQAQDQQMKLLECYVQLRRISEVLKCIENMRDLVARHPRPKAVDVYQLGLDNLEKSSHIKAIACFACAAKIYSFESDADEAVRRIEDCSFKSREAVKAMIKQSERTRLFARDVGMEIMNSIVCDVTEVSNANPDLKAEMEARCLKYTGICYRKMKLHEKAIGVYKRGIDILNRQFPENSSKYQGFGRLLNNMGFANEDLGNYSEAESLYERSIDAKQRAEDWLNDGQKKKSIERTHKNLRNTRRKNER